MRKWRKKKFLRKHRLAEQAPLNAVETTVLGGTHNNGHLKNKQSPLNAAETTTPQSAVPPSHHHELLKPSPSVPVVPTTRSFEEDDLFVRDPEDEAAPQPRPRRRHRNRNRSLAEEVPTARGFEDDDELFVRDPEEGAAEAAPPPAPKRRHRKKNRRVQAVARDLDEDLFVREVVPVPKDAENLQTTTPEPVPQVASEKPKKRRHRKKHPKPAAEVPTTRDHDEDLFTRMVETLTERDLLDLEHEVVARDGGYEMNWLD
jgi:hypothetical protein